MKKLLTIIILISCLSLADNIPSKHISFANQYLEKDELYLYDQHASTNLTNIDESFNDYSIYLQETLSDIPFSQVFYTNTPYFVSTGNMIFVFDFENISSVVYQAVQSEAEFNAMLEPHYKRFGTPLHNIKQGTVSKLVWETPTANILMSHVIKPLGHTMQEIILENPHPGFAFSDLPNINFSTSIAIWKILRENKIISLQGLAIRSNLYKKLSSLESLLAPLDLTDTTVQKIKVLLLATTLGETNIMYLNKEDSFLFQDNPLEDEGLEAMIQ